MIIKMKFLSITGPKSDIDRVSSEYLSKYEIQLENAISELKTSDILLPFAELNPYKEPLAKADYLVNMLEDKNIPANTSFSTEELQIFAKQLHFKYSEIQDQITAMENKKADLLRKLSAIEPFQNLTLNLHKAIDFRFMKVKLGRVHVDNFHKFEKYIYHNLNALFLEASRTGDYVYGAYIVANSEANKANSAFRSLHFENIYLGDFVSGTPADAYADYAKELHLLNKELDTLKKTAADILSQDAEKIIGCRNRLDELSSGFEVRKLAALVPSEEEEDYYILCGWMSEEDANSFIEESKQDDKVFIVVEEEQDKYFGESPTKLKNPSFFKPFEMYTRMYGLPAHNEIDPTIFIGLTYTFLFGAMFGDVGQGLVLFIGGQLLYRFKKMDLAGIISIAGIFSTFFGFMFGSVFGFENIIEAVWLHPASAMLKLPFVGRLNTVFVVAVAFGMALNLLVMIFQIINAYKAHDLENLFFSQNGITGIIFYGFIVLTVVLYMSGNKIPANILLALFLGIPVLIFLFKEPLGCKLEKKKFELESGKGMFIAQGIFELIEIMLSYFSNTLSYVRVGAFAVSHAAMMEVVLMLAGALDGGSPNWLIVVFGNILVMGMEGLVVGIQVLRLEYYELFSRFYKGTGREFKPYKTRHS